MFLANITVQAESQLYNLEQAERGICLYVNTVKTEFMHFKQDDAISTLYDKPLKLVDLCTYLGSNITLTQNNVNIHIGKAWTTINKLSTIWKSNLSSKIK